VFYNDPCRVAAAFYDRYPDRQEKEKKTLVELKQLPASKISGSHHLHFTALEAYCIAKESNAEAVEIAVRLPDDATTTMAAGVILWASALQGEALKLVRKSGLFKAATMSEFGKVGKSLSTAMKSYQNLTDLDLRQLFEIDVLVNRVMGAVDWMQEKQNRLHPALVTLSYDHVYNEARKVFQDAAVAGKRPTTLHWDTYWASRWQWSAAGSVHSQHAADLQYVCKQRELKNKFITLASMPKVEQNYFLNRQSEIAAWTSTKYEWGKQRAIYGTDLTSYVLAHFAFYNCENVLPAQFPVGKAANVDNVGRRVAAVLNNKLPFCLDYADFNSQHSNQAMRAVILAYGDTFSASLTPAQREALLWTADSLEKVLIIDNIGTGTSYRATGTLLSGWRLTSFMNSVLNYVYTRAIAGQHLSAGQSLHNGDDVLIGANNLAITQLCSRNAQRYGIRMQAPKCAFGGIAEFLRVDHLHGSAGQYLTRATATMVHSRIESRVSTDARDLIAAMEMRFNDALNRGMSVNMIARLRDRYYHRQAKICSMDVEDMYRIKNTHRVAGGISEEKDATVTCTVTPSPLDTTSVELPTLPGVYDYARELQRQLLTKVDIKAINKRIIRATYEAVVIKNRKMTLTVPEDREWYCTMKALHKAHRGHIPTANYGKAAMTGFAIEVINREAPDSVLARFLASAKRPIEALALVV
jgi:hypothetical protein